jgi:hypothetical protein
MATEITRAGRFFRQVTGRWIEDRAWARNVRLVAASALVALLGGGVAPSSPAAAASVCGDRGAILKRLEERHHETRHGLGLSSDGAVFEVLVAPDGGWTILATDPKKGTCVIAIGKAWQILQLTGGERA